MITTLPTVKLNSIDYIIDFRLQELRRVDNPHDVIKFERLKDEGDFYTVKFIKGTDNELAGDGLYEYGSLIECSIPSFCIEYPAQMVNEILESQKQ